MSDSSTTVTLPIQIDTGTDQLLARQEGRVGVVTLNRPEARNALSDQLTPALRQMIKRFGEDDSVGCVLLTGAGTAFCAGGDVKGMGGDRKKTNSPPKGANRKKKDPPPSLEDAAEDLRLRQETLTGALYELPKPTLAALPGPAAGAGLSIALACDLRIAAASAFIITAFRRIGLSGDYGASYFLSKLVGSAKARELFFLSERVSAQECERLGIVNRVVEDEDLQSEAMKLAQSLAAGPAVAIRLMKKNLDLAQHGDLHACLAQEAAHMVQSGRTEDHREAVRAFVEKREPVFVGR